jgi:hypothetical protein
MYLLREQRTHHPYAERGTGNGDIILIDAGEGREQRLSAVSRWIRAFNAYSSAASRNLLTHSLVGIPLAPQINK